MPRVAVQGGHLHYELKGRGTPVVLLRGLARSARHWLGFDERLAASHQVLTLDARGLGQSDAPVPFSLTVEDLARDVNTVMDAAGLACAHIVGVSLGGMVSLAMGMHFPARVQSMTIINSSIGGSGAWRLTPSGLKSLLYGLTHPRHIHQALAEVLIAPDLAPERRRDVIAKWRQIERDEAGMGVPTAFKQLLAAARFRVRHRLPQLMIPSLVVYGTADAFVPQRNSEFIFNLLPRAKLRKIVGGGHEVMLDHSDELLAVLREFIQAQAPERTVAEAIPSTR